jgi:hypothetical protein
VNFVSEKIAEITSSCPDSSVRFSCKTPYEYLSTLILLRLALPGRTEYQYYKWAQEVANVCYKNNYQGKWKLVQEFLELEYNYPAGLFEELTKNFNLHDIYGNFIPTLSRVSRTVKIRTGQSRKRKVKRSQRKRGYDDKGTLRLQHERHSAWNWTGPNPERDDKRDNVTAPKRRVFWTKKGSD